MRLDRLQGGRDFGARPRATATTPRSTFVGAFGPAEADPTPPFADLPALRQSAQEDPIPSFVAVPVLRKPVGGADALLGRFLHLGFEDVTVLAAGLAVLLMAPLPEVMISAPKEDDDTLRPGFAQDRKGLIEAGQPYEDGVAGGVASGSLLGEERELISPLNARDPGSLIIHDSERAEMKDAPRGRASRVSPTPSDDWKDALVSAARRSASSVARRIPMPRPSARLPRQLNSIFSSVSSGGHSSAALNIPARPSRTKSFGRPADSNLSRISPPADYRGTAMHALAMGANGPRSWGGTSGTTAGAAASGDGGGFLRPSQGGAGGRAVPQGGGPDFDGASRQPGLNGPTGDAKISLQQKEDLNFLRRKMEMEKALDLKYAKKQYDQIERKKMLLQTAGQALSQLSNMLDRNRGQGGGGDGGSGGSKGGGQGGAGSGGNGQSAPAQNASSHASSGQQHWMRVRGAPVDGHRNSIPGAANNADTHGFSSDGTPVSQTGNEYPVMENGRQVGFRTSDGGVIDNETLAQLRARGETAEPSSMSGSNADGSLQLPTADGGSISAGKLGHLPPGVKASQLAPTGAGFTITGGPYAGGNLGSNGQYTPPQNGGSGAAGGK